MGRSKKTIKCPRCASKDVLFNDSFEEGIELYVCADCDYEFEVGGSLLKNRDFDYDLEDNFDLEETEDEWN